MLIGQPLCYERVYWFTYSTILHFLLKRKEDSNNVAINNINNVSINNINNVAINNINNVAIILLQHPFIQPFEKYKKD